MAKGKFEELFNSNSFSKEKKHLQKYSSDRSFVSGNEPRCVVKPEDAEEVRKLVNLAVEEETPLIPVSSGTPRFRGDTVPEDDGVVTVDFLEMNEIKMVDRPDRVAMIEPGVRFSDLQGRLEKEDLRLPSPLCPKSSKSVVGSFLEREPHIIPKYHLDHSEPLLCNEVIFGTGDLFRTGESGTLGTIEEQWEAGRRQKNPEGQQININRILQGSQGTLGIVTWSTVRCEISPQIQKPFFAYKNDLQAILELAYRLVRFRLGDEILILNNQNLAALSGYSTEDLEESLPQWILFLCIGGYEHRPEERIEYQEKDIGSVPDLVEVLVLPPP